MVTLQQGLEPDRLSPTAIATMPPRADCELTKVGRSLREPGDGLSLRVSNNRTVIVRNARRRFAAAGKHG